jgi:hypothetical protein
MYVIDLKDRTVAEFTKSELITFANTCDYKKMDKGRFWVLETRDRAVKVIKNLIKKGF